MKSFKKKVKILSLALASAMFLSGITVKAEVDYRRDMNHDRFPNEYQTENKWRAPLNSSLYRTYITWNIEKIKGPHLAADGVPANETLVLVQGEEYTINASAKIDPIGYVTIPEAFMTIGGSYTGDGQPNGEKFPIGSLSTGGNTHLSGEGKFTVPFYQEGESVNKELSVDFYGKRSDLWVKAIITAKYALITGFLKYKLGALVKFDLDGGKLNGASELESKVLECGKKVELNGTPVKEGHKFTGWEVEGKTYKTVSEIPAIIKNTTIKAIYEEVNITLPVSKKVTWDSAKEAYKVELSVTGVEKKVKEGDKDVVYSAKSVRATEKLSDEVQFVKEDLHLNIGGTDNPVSLNDKDSWEKDGRSVVYNSDNKKLSVRFTDTDEMINENETRTFTYYVKVTEAAAEKNDSFENADETKNIVMAAAKTGTYENNFGYKVSEKSDLDFRKYKDSADLGYRSQSFPVAVVRPAKNKKEETLTLPVSKKVTWDSEKEAYKVELSVTGKEVLVDEKGTKKKLGARNIVAKEELSDKVELLTDGITLTADGEEIPVELRDGVWRVDEGFTVIHDSEKRAITFRYTKENEELQENKIRTATFFVRLKGEVVKKEHSFDEEDKENKIRKGDPDTGDYADKFGYEISKKSELEFYVLKSGGPQSFSHQFPVAVVRPVIKGLTLTPPKKVIPWTELTPAKKVIPWTELTPAKPITDPIYVPYNPELVVPVEPVVPEQPEVPTEDIIVSEDEIPQGEAMIPELNDSVEEEVEMEAQDIEEELQDIEIGEEEIPQGKAELDTKDGKNLAKTGGREVFFVPIISVFGILLLLLFGFFRIRKRN